MLSEPIHTEPPTQQGGLVVQWAQERGEVGGVMTSHRQMSEVLRAGGNDVVYIDTGSALRAARALASVWRRPALHVLHITRVWRAALLAPVLALARGRRALVMHSGSTAGQLSAMGPGRRRILLGLLRVFDELWVVNDSIRELLPAPLAARTTVVTPFDAEGLTPPPSSLRDSHALVLATNAGLPQYNADVGIEAARIVRQQWADATLRILAYGHYGPELEGLRAVAADNDWIEVSFDLSPNEVAAVLQRSGVFLRPTSWDGDSVIVREAIGLGARVIASPRAPRPRGAELAALDPVSFAHAIVHGGRPSDGAGVVDTTMAMVALRSLSMLQAQRGGWCP